MRRFLAALLACACISTCVEATPIIFTFVGTAAGLVGNTTFTEAAFTIGAGADTLNVVTSATGDGAPGGDFSLDTDLAQIAIEGGWELSFSEGTRVFDAKGVTVNSEGLFDLLRLLMDFAASGTDDLLTALDLSSEMR
jgi:hypothetical protein